jgi:hypothetical protein
MASIVFHLPISCTSPCLPVRRRPWEKPQDTTNELSYDRPSCINLSVLIDQWYQFLSYALGRLVSSIVQVCVLRSVHVCESMVVPNDMAGVVPRGVTLGNLTEWGPDTKKNLYLYLHQRSIGRVLLYFKFKPSMWSPPALTCGVLAPW